MKKIISLFIAFICMMSVYAYEGYGTCKIDGTTDYLEGTAYINLSGSSLSGNLVISNSSMRPLQSASINVTVDYSYKQASKSPYDGSKVVNQYNQTVTLYNSRWTGNIAGYQSGSINLSGSLSLPSDAYGIQIKSVNVSISNPYCN